MTIPNTPGSLAGHKHEWVPDPFRRPFATKACKICGVELEAYVATLEAENAQLKTTNWIAVAYQEMDRADALEARLEAAERIITAACHWKESKRKALLSKDAVAIVQTGAILSDELGPAVEAYEALTRPATAAEQEAGK